MKRILIVDDAATVRLYHRNILEPAGYEVEESTNGVEALALSGSAKISAFLRPCSTLACASSTPNSAPPRRLTTSLSRV